MKIGSAFLGMVLVSVAFAGGIATGQIAAGQAAAPQPGSGRTVTLDVVVTNKANRAVADLKAEDFKVLDNKGVGSNMRLRAVGGEGAAADLPVEAILLVDTINTPFETMAKERKEIENYIAGRGGHLAIPTSLVFLGETDLKFQGEPTRDAKVLLANLEKNPNPQRSFQPQGGFQQGVQMRQKSLEALNGLALKLRDRPGRKLVVWIGPGWPAFPQQTIQKSAQEMQGLFDYIVGISTILREARITLYSVDPQGVEQGLLQEEAPREQSPVGTRQDMGQPEAAFTYYKEFLKGVASPKQADNGDLFLQVIATQTGGKVLYGSNDIAKLIDECLSDAEAFFVLTYDAPAAIRANEYHAIQIQMNKPGLKARTLSGYYAQP